MMPHKLNGTLLMRDQWQDNLRLQCGLRPLGICAHCNGCVVNFSIEHGLSCKKGVLVSIRHNDTRDKAGALAALALTQGKVSYEPMINHRRDLTAAQPSAPRRTGNAAGEEARGNVLVHGMWERGSGCVLNTRVTDTDAKSYQNQSSENILERAAKAKKDKYFEACPVRRRSFMTLIYSVDAMAHKEAMAYMKRIASLLAEK